MSAPACEPTATISSPTLVTRPSVWLMPRPLAAATKSLPARVAGGKPREVAGGAGPGLPLFAPAITTTATPKTTIARIGIATLIPQPRNSRPARNSRDQRRLTGWGSSERSRLAHSAPAVLGSGRTPWPPWTPWPPGPSWPLPARPAGRSEGDRRSGGAAFCVRSSNSNPGMAGGSSSGHACGGTDSGWLTVGVYRKAAARRRRRRLASPGVPPVARHVLGPHVPGPGWPAGGPGRAALGWVRLGPRPGRERRPSNSNPGAVPLHGSGGRTRGEGPGRPAQAGGAGGPMGPRRRQPRDGRSVPWSRVPCRQEDGPRGKCRKRGMNPENLYAIPADGTGRPPA